MNQSLNVQALETRLFVAGESLEEFLKIHLKPHANNLEGKVLAITSKIVSLSENRLVPKSQVSKKESLVRQEADTYFGEIGYGCFLTIKHGLFIASAGIDESNSKDGHYILYPKDPFKTAHQLCDFLKKEFEIQNFGILITDSHTSPLRAGVTGITLSHHGFRAVKNQIGTPDLYNRPLQMTRINIADALSTASVLCMGEANEARPLALIDAAVEFIENLEEKPTEGVISMEQDLYAPLYKAFLRDKT